MREILFRGKTDKGEWVEGFLCKKYFQELPHDRCVIQYITTGDENKWTPKYMVAEIDPETVGQYTGLTDKKGTKIFEGDIVTADVYEREYEDEYLSNTPIKVTYCGGYFYPFHLEGCWRSGVSNIEIIGNIHDNPELLGGANNG